MVRLASLPILAVAPARLGLASEPVIPWLRIVLALLLCLALAVVAIQVVRRRQAPGAAIAAWLVPAPGRIASQPELVGRLRLSPAGQVVVLHWAGEHYLIHVGPAGAQLLDRRAAGDPAS